MNHLDFITRCLQLAEQGRGHVRTNPLVGSVLVRDNTMIAEAFHSAYGEAHAERTLLAEFKGDIEPEDTLYVNLEPCCHSGKTPPCTDIIIERGVRRVVFGMMDPNPAVSGQGRAALKTAGVDVIGPIDAARCRRFNRGFVSLQEQGRPWITLKRAQTRDGRIANPDGSPLKITSPAQDEWAHAHLRGKHDAILVGVGTIVRDDPLLTNRATDFQPVKVVLDPSLKIPLDARVLRGNAIVITAETDHPSISALEEMGVTVAHVPIVNGTFDWKKLWLGLPQVASILVEGGAETWRRFKEAGLIDEEVILVG